MSDHKTYIITSKELGVIESIIKEDERILKQPGETPYMRTIRLRELIKKIKMQDAIKKNE